MSRRRWRGSSSDVRAQRALAVDGDDAFAWQFELIQSAVQAASLAEAAREELPTLPWELRLRESIDAERERLRLDMDRRTFHVYAPCVTCGATTAAWCGAAQTCMDAGTRFAEVVEHDSGALRGQPRTRPVKGALAR